MRVSELPGRTTPPALATRSVAHGKNIRARGDNASEEADESVQDVGAGAAHRVVYSRDHGWVLRDFARAIPRLASLAPGEDQGRQ